MSDHAERLQALATNLIERIENAVLGLDKPGLIAAFLDARSELVDIEQATLRYYAEYKEINKELLRLEDDGGD